MELHACDSFYGVACLCTLCPLRICTPRCIMNHRSPCTSLPCTRCQRAQALMQQKKKREAWMQHFACAAFLFKDLLSLLEHCSVCLLAQSHLPISRGLVAAVCLVSRHKSGVILPTIFSFLSLLVSQPATNQLDAPSFPPQQEESGAAAPRVVSLPTASLEPEEGTEQV